MSTTETAHLHGTRTISLEGAKQIAAAAEQEAARNGWNVVIAVVDGSGELILLHRRDGTQLASVSIATGKARTAARFKRPTKLLEDAVAGGRTAMLAVEGIVPMEGGIPVIVDGQVLGAVGVSGVLSSQDAQVAQAGIDALQLG
jgi:glc operon protein GlcG